VLKTLICIKRLFGRLLMSFCHRSKKRVVIVVAFGLIAGSEVRYREIFL